MKNTTILIGLITILVCIDSANAITPIQLDVNLLEDGANIDTRKLVTICYNTDDASTPPNPLPVSINTAGDLDPVEGPIYLWGLYDSSYDPCTSGSDCKSKLCASFGIFSSGTDIIIQVEGYEDHTFSDVTSSVGPADVDLTPTGTSPPSATILHPNGGESTPIGTQVQVSAHATDDTAVTSVTFSYSSNGGSDWNSIGAGAIVSGTDKDGIWNGTWNTDSLGAGSNYLIKAVASDGTSPDEDQSDSTFSLTCTPPSPPTLNDPGTTDTDGSYTVSWSSVSGATNYTLEEDTSGSFGSPTVVYSGSGTSTQITGRSNGTYYYRVSACNACGCGGWSNVEAIEVLTRGKEVCRNLPSESQIAGDIIVVSLDVAVGSATYYLIDEVVPTGWTVVSASGGGSTVVAGHVRWAVISGVADTTLTYNVQIPHGASGTYTFGPGEWMMTGMSNPEPIHCDTVVMVCAPPTPTLNDPGTTDTDGSYTVRWSSVSGATGYTLEEDTGSSFGSPAVVYSGSGMSKHITGRSNGTYYYRVKACNVCRCGGWSNVEDIEVGCAGTDVVEFSGEIVRLTDAQTADIIWDKNNFGGFYYDINGGIGTETLIIATGTLAGPNVDRTIETGALTYTTHSIWREYKLHKNLGLIVDSDHPGGDSGYWVGFWRGEEYVAIGGTSSKLVKPLVEFNSADVKILETGDPWNLGGGFALEAKQINLAADGVWFCLYKNGIKLDDEVIHPSDSNLQERVYTYTQDVAGEDNIPIFSCYVSELYSDQVQIKYIFLIDTNVTEIYIGDEYSIMGVKTISPSAVILKNNIPIDLAPDTTTPLMSNLSLKTTDNTGAIEFYPHIIRKKSHVLSGDGGFIGDLNHDGILTPADAAIALQIAATGGWDPAADVDGDSRITSLDVLMILQAAADGIEI